MIASGVDLLTSTQHIWLASWPRSGNTLLRMVLFHLLGLKSASLYGADERVSGAFVDDDSRLVKTHDLPSDDGPAIYVVRDGREACVSYYHFLTDDNPAEKATHGSTIRGSTEHRFCNWSQHLRAWRPKVRPHTLLLTYEMLVDDPSGCSGIIGEFLGVQPLQRLARLPSFESLHAAAPRFFRSGTNDTWTTELTPDALELFWRLHGDMMLEYGYLCTRSRANAKSA